MIGKFYNIEYIPNRLAYVYEVTKEEINFLAFFSENGDGLKAIKHSVNKALRKDFRTPSRGYKSTPQINELITNVLTK